MLKSCRLFGLFSVICLLGAWAPGCAEHPSWQWSGDAVLPGGDGGESVVLSDASQPGDRAVPPNPGFKTYYVRPGGGSPAQCTGLTNGDYPGSGTGRACAFKHPFHALPPGGTPRIKGGDTLVIAAGSYRMGHGAPGAEGCSRSMSYDCHMPPIPSGTAQARTRILGEGWDSGCKSGRPELFGVERPWRVINLLKSSHVELQCLEITDHSTCVSSHEDGKYRCQRGSAPYGDWAPTGIEAADSDDVLLKNLDIHGLSHHGVLAGKLSNWTVDTVRIAANGWVGWDGDISAQQGSSSCSGTMRFVRLTVEWNGCAETYPGKQPTACWGQSAGGYGDGLGTAATAGNWIFEQSSFLHNVSDGLDLLYHEGGGTVRLDRVHAEGNGGNPVKVCGDTTIVNSLIVSNCAFFEGKPFTHRVDHCRALGNALSLSFQAGKKVVLVNSTIYGRGDVLVSAGARHGFSCDGSESLTAVNNIFVGGPDYHQPGEKSALFYTSGSCPGLTFGADYNIVHNVKNDCTVGSHDLCRDPLLTRLSGERFDLRPKAGSPAVDSGKAVGGAVPGRDFRGVARPRGKGVDRGAYEQ